MPSSVRLITPPHIAENRRLSDEMKMLRAENTELRAALAAASGGGPVPHVPTQRERIMGGNTTFTSPRDGSQVQLMTREEASSRSAAPGANARRGEAQAGGPRPGQTIRNQDGSTVQLMGGAPQRVGGAGSNTQQRSFPAAPAAPAPPAAPGPLRVLHGASLPPELMGELMAQAALPPGTPQQNAAPKALPSGDLQDQQDQPVHVSNPPQHPITELLPTGKFPQAEADVDPVALIELD